jgi:hypothetical protein
MEMFHPLLYFPQHLSHQELHLAANHKPKLANGFDMLSALYICVCVCLPRKIEFPQRKTEKKSIYTNVSIWCFHLMPTPNVENMDKRMKLFILFLY